MSTRKCDYCSAEFVVNYKLHRRFCSRKCGQRFENNQKRKEMVGLFGAGQRVRCKKCGGMNTQSGCYVCHVKGLKENGLSRSNQER